MLKGIIISSMAAGIGGVLALGLPSICIPLTALAGCVAIGLVIAADNLEADDEE